MMLWDDVGGRTWIERAGPHTSVAEADSRPHRRRRLVSRIRPTVPAPRVDAPEGSR